MYDNDSEESHSTYLLEIILNSYYNVIKHYETMKNINLSEKELLRDINTKTILFRNEYKFLNV